MGYTCAITLMINLSNLSWVPHDHKTLRSAQKRCPVMYKHSPCLVKFTKRGFQVYRAICGKHIEGRAENNAVVKASSPQFTKRYGALDKEFKWSNMSKWIIRFKWSDYGPPFKDIWINRDMYFDLHVTLLDLKAKGLLSEIGASYGGYNGRAIAGTNRPSYHAYGLAIDIVPKYKKKWSEEFLKVWRYHGWCLGKDFAKSDPMHFSWNGYECRGLTNSTNIPHIHN